MQTIKEKLREKAISYYLNKETGKMKGIGEVAEKVGLTVQTLRDIATGRLGVTLDTLLAFSAAYPGEFDELLAEAFNMKATPSGEATATLDTAEEVVSTLTSELAAWSARYDKLEKATYNWQNRYLSLSDSMLKQINPELSFLQSGSRVTAKFSKPGFKHYDDVQDAKVIMHPAMVNREATVLALQY